MDVATYLRMSDDSQATSIRDQRSAIAEFCRRNGHTIVAEYVDHGISGDDTDRRREFQRMIRDAAESRCGFRAIVVWDLSRFGRFDMLEAGYWMTPLRRSGIDVITLDKGKINWHDFAGRLVWGVEQEGKHAYLRDLARGVVRGSTSVALRGLYCGGPVATGYTVDGSGRLIVGSDDAVALVRSIFDSFASGLSLRGVAEKLNGAGIPSPCGKKWSSETVRAMLRNRTYLGEYRWAKNRKGKYSHATDEVVIPGNHPALITVEQFNNVQHLMDRRSKPPTPHRNGGSFVLSGLIRCGVCGHAMHGTTENSGRTVRYRCRSLRPAACSGSTVDQSDVLSCVAATLADEWISDSIVAKVRTEIERRMNEQRASGSRSVATAKRRIAATEAEIAKLERRLVEVDSEFVHLVQSELRKKRSELASIVAEIGGEATRSRTAKNAVMSFTESVDSMRAGIAKISTAPPAATRQFLRSVVASIVVFSASETRGKKRFHSLDHGVINVRCPSLDNLSVTGSRVCQLAGPRPIAFRRVKPAAATRSRP